MHTVVGIQRQLRLPREREEPGRRPGDQGRTGAEVRRDHARRPLRARHQLVRLRPLGRSTGQRRARSAAFRSDRIRVASRSRPTRTPRTSRSWARATSPRSTCDKFAVSWMYGVGSGPRHLVLSPDGRWLYATLNGAGTIAKIDLDDPHRRGAGRHRREPAVDGDLGRRAGPLCRQLQLRHGEQAAGERHVAAPDDRDAAPSDRHHLRPQDRQCLGRVLRRPDPCVLRHARRADELL